MSQYQAVPHGMQHAGYKVAVVEQLETAAEAKKRNPKNPLIMRRIVNAVSSRATALEPAGQEQPHLVCIVANREGLPCQSQAAVNNALTLHGLQHYVILTSDDWIFGVLVVCCSCCISPDCRA